MTCFTCLCMSDLCHSPVRTCVNALSSLLHMWFMDSEDTLYVLPQSRCFSSQWVSVALQYTVWFPSTVTPSAWYNRAPLALCHVTAAELDWQMREACTLVGEHGTEVEEGKDQELIVSFTLF